MSMCTLCDISLRPLKSSKNSEIKFNKQTKKSLKVLQWDRGDEHFSEKFLNYLKEHGIVSQWIPSRMPQLNGISEQKNQTLLDMVRSMMSFIDLFNFF